MNKGAKKTLRKLIIAVPLMFAFGFALVPLYDVFCEVTGLNGKVFQSESNDSLVIDDGRSIALQFISTNNEKYALDIQALRASNEDKYRKVSYSNFFCKKYYKQENGCSSST